MRRQSLLAAQTHVLSSECAPLSVLRSTPFVIGESEGTGGVHGTPAQAAVAIPPVRSAANLRVCLALVMAAARREMAPPGADIWHALLDASLRPEFESTR